MRGEGIWCHGMHNPSLEVLDAIMRRNLHGVDSTSRILLTAKVIKSGPSHLLLAIESLTLTGKVLR